MKYLLFGAALCALTLTTQAQDAQQAPTNTDPTLMTVGGESVSRSEFESIYKKNNKDAPVTKEALDQYLELFTNYKLKVRAAEDLGMDTAASFKSELAGYRQQLARPYLIDRGLNDQLMQEAYSRMGEEIRASHILVKVAEDASPEDTLTAWKRINALRAEVVGGKDFGAVAKSSSEDPSAKENTGDLGYFSVLQMVYPFENAAYNTPVGQVSQPVRTKFGYHIIKVTDRRPAHGEITAAHIMIRSTDEDSPEKQAAAKKKIDEAYAELQSGTINFTDAALKYSDDATTNTKGGELPPFGTGKMIPEFESQAFALKADGDYSEPFKTPYGWHIVKRLSYKPLPSFDEAKTELKTKISHDSRAEVTRQKFLAGLRTEYHYKEFPKNLTAVEKALDTTVFKKGNAILDTLMRKDVKEGIVMHNGQKYERSINSVLKSGRPSSPNARQPEGTVLDPNDTLVVRDVQVGWEFDSVRNAKLTKPVFTIDGKTYTQKDLLRYIQEKQRHEPARPMKAYVQERFQKFVDDQLLAYEDSRLEDKYPEFRMLMKEYRDGILLFELTDEKVWSKAVKDTTGLQQYYDQHKTDYMYPVRYDVDIYTCKTAGVDKQVRSLLKKGKSSKDILAVVNKKDSTALSVESGVFTKEDKPMLKDMTAPGLSADTTVDGKVMFVSLNKVVEPTPKPLNESRGLVTAAYQDQLEKDWIKELRAKYPVTVNKEVLYSIK